MSNEIINETQAEVVETLTPVNKFNRADFNNPTTLLNYGEDVLAEMEQIVSDATKNIENDGLPDAGFKTRVDRLSNFSDELDDVEEKRDKRTKYPLLISRVINVFKGKKSEKALSYNGVLKQYTDNIDLLVEDVRKMYEASKSDFELFNTFIKEIKPYVGILDEVYKFGKMDRDKFEAEVVLLEQKFQSNPEDSDLRRESIIKRQSLDFFDERLYSIQKSKIAVNEIIIQWNMRQINAIKQLSSYQSFLSLDKSILKLNGTALVGAKKQKEDAELLEHLINGVNKALVEGPKELNSVIGKVNELTKDGNIKIETFSQIDQLLQQGVNLLRQGAIEKKEFIENSSKQLSIIAGHFNEFNVEVRESILLEAYNNSDNNSNNKALPNVKSKGQFRK